MRTIKLQLACIRRDVTALNVFRSALEAKNWMEFHRRRAGKVAGGVAWATTARPQYVRPLCELDEFLEIAMPGELAPNGRLMGLFSNGSKSFSPYELTRRSLGNLLLQFLSGKNPTR